MCLFFAKLSYVGTPPTPFLSDTAADWPVGCLAGRVGRRTKTRAPRRRGCGTRSTGGAPGGAPMRPPAVSSPSWRAPRCSGSRTCSPPRCPPPRPLTHPTPQSAGGQVPAPPPPHPPPQPAGGQVRPGRVLALAPISDAPPDIRRSSPLIAPCSGAGRQLQHDICQAVVPAERLKRCSVSCS